MLQELRNVPGTEHSWVVTIEAELVILLLNSGMQATAIPAEADTEQELVLSRVSEEETPLGLFLKKFFCFIPVHLSPIERASCYLFKERDKVVHIVHLGVGPRVHGHFRHPLLSDHDVILTLLSLRHYLTNPPPPSSFSWLRHDSPLS